MVPPDNTNNLASTSRISVDHHSNPNFRVSRAASITSTSSRVSTITTALKNAWRRPSSRTGINPTHDDPYHSHSDDVSIASGPSSSIPRRLNPKSSTSSIRSSHSGRPTPLDTRSISSQQTGSGLSSRTGRTSNSKGPPSSYHRPKRGPRQPLELDGEESSAEIRAEIAAVEAEKNQLMDNFQGLEMSSLSRNGNGTSSRSRSSSSGGTGGGGERPSSMWTITPDTLRSSSPLPPPVPKLPTLPPHPPHPPGPSIAARKRSLGMLSTASVKFSKSRDHIPAVPPAAPPPELQPVTPAKSSSSSRTGFFRRKTPTPPSSSQRTPIRSISAPMPKSAPATPHPHPRSVETAAAPTSVGVDERLETIRRRKVETAAKYDQRLDFLRARLKGAELREKLM